MTEMMMLPVVTAYDGFFMFDIVYMKNTGAAEENKLFKTIVYV